MEIKKNVLCKKILAVALCVCTLMCSITISAEEQKASLMANPVGDGANYFVNGSFEDKSNIELSIVHGVGKVESGDRDASDGVYSLCVKTPNNYVHLGIPVALEVGCTYEFSYDIKIVSDYSGNAFSTNVAYCTNFIFADSKAQSGKNHIINGGKTMTDGWNHVNGTFVVDSAAIAADATPGEAKFSIYTDNPAGTGVVWRLDNLVLKKKKPADRKSTRLNSSHL